MARRVTNIENSLWQAADQLRTNLNLSAEECSFPVLDLIFLRYTSVRFSKIAAKQKANSGNSRQRSFSEVGHQARDVICMCDDARFQRLLVLPKGKKWALKNGAYCNERKTIWFDETTDIITAKVIGDLKADLEQFRLIAEYLTNI